MNKNIVLCTILVTVLYAGCGFSSQTQQSTTELYILIDITDTLSAKVQVDAILGMKDELWQGKTVYIGTIEDVPHTPVSIFTLPPENELWANIHARQSKVSAFIYKIDSSLERIVESHIAPKPRSVVLYTVLTALETLSQKSGKRILYIYSDLMEYSAVDFYKSETLEALHTNPDAVTKKLLKGQPIPDLTGIEVFLCYRPKDYSEGQTYAIVSEYYTRLFEAHGAVVRARGGF